MDRIEIHQHRLRRPHDPRRFLRQDEPGARETSHSEETCSPLGQNDYEETMVRSSWLSLSLAVTACSPGSPGGDSHSASPSLAAPTAAESATPEATDRSSTNAP